MTQQMKQSHDTDESNQRMVADARLMPWSYCLPILWGRFLIDLASGIVVGMVGTMSHRMGASMNVPYGLLIAYLMVIISTWSARSRDGVSGLALHLISSSLVVWTVMAGYGPGGDAMIPVGFGGRRSHAVLQCTSGIFLAIRSRAHSDRDAGITEMLVRHASAQEDA